MPFSESWLDILLLPITILGFWIAFRQSKEDKTFKSKKPDLMNLMNFIYENYMKFSFLFDLREHDLIYKEIQEQKQNKDTKNEIYVSFDDFNLHYIVASSQIPEYMIEPDKFAIESKEIYEMSLKIKQYINQYNETLNLFCENDGKWERNSIVDFRNILERISKETFLNTLELYNSLQDVKTNFRKKKILSNNKNDFSSFRKNRERQINDRLDYKKKSADGMWTEPTSLLLLRLFLCIPYTIKAANTANIQGRKRHHLLYHTFLYEQLSNDSSKTINNKLIQDVTKAWIQDPKTHTHFFVCDYITTIGEFLTYSSLKSKFTRCKLGNIFEYSNKKIFVGAKDISPFLKDIQRLNINPIIIDISNSSEGEEIDFEKFYYIKAHKIDDAINYVNSHLIHKQC